MKKIGVGVFYGKNQSGGLLFELITMVALHYLYYDGSQSYSVNQGSALRPERTSLSLQTARDPPVLHLLPFQAPV